MVIIRDLRLGSPTTIPQKGHFLFGLAYFVRDP